MKELLERPGGWGIDPDVLNQMLDQKITELVLELAHIEMLQRIYGVQ